jgi:hypothetical protein
VPAGFPFEGDEVYYPKIVAVVHGQSIHLNAGWGPIHVPLPLPDAITVIAGPDFRRTT